MTDNRSRDTFGEIMEGIEQLKAHREGRLTLRTHKVEAPTLPPVDPLSVREIRRRAQAATEGVPGLTWDETRKRVEEHLAHIRKGRRSRGEGRPSRS